MTTTGWRGLVVALAFGLALVYGLMVPLGEAPDEPGHYNYARIMASEQRLPKADEEHESFQPPLQPRIEPFHLGHELLPGDFIHRIPFPQPGGQSVPRGLVLAEAAAQVAELGIALPIKRSRGCLGIGVPLGAIGHPPATGGAPGIVARTHTKAAASMKLAAADPAQYCVSDAGLHVDQRVVCVTLIPLGVSVTEHDVAPLVVREGVVVPDAA